MGGGGGGGIHREVDGSGMNLCYLRIYVRTYARKTCWCTLREI